MTPHIIFTMTHESTVQRFKNIVKVGTVSKQNFPQSPHHKHKYTWCLSGGSAILVIKLLQPYLHTKLAQADLAIEFAERCMVDRESKSRLDDDQRRLRRILLQEMRELNKKGV